MAVVDNRRDRGRPVRVVANVKDVVYCVLADGPYAGTVYEVGGNDRELQIRHPSEGVCVYRRSHWAPTKEGHRIAFFKFTKQLVV